MKRSIFISIVFVVIHNSRGDHGNNVQQSSRTTSLSFNSFLDTEEFNPFIFDAYDPQMIGTYHALLKIYKNHLLNSRKYSLKGLDVNFEAELFWKTLKLTAAYLKYEHHRNSNPANNNRSSELKRKPPEGDVLLNELYQYYLQLVLERNSSKNETKFIPILGARKSYANEMKYIFDRSVDHIKRRWMQTKIFCLKVGNSIRRVNRIGATFVNLLSHLTKRWLPKNPFKRSSHSLLDYKINITQALRDQEYDFHRLKLNFP